MPKTSAYTYFRVDVNFRREARGGREGPLNFLSFPEAHTPP